MKTRKIIFYLLITLNIFGAYSIIKIFNFTSGQIDIAPSKTAYLNKKSEQILKRSIDIDSVRNQGVRWMTNFKNYRKKESKNATALLKYELYILIATLTNLLYLVTTKINGRIT